MHQLPLCEIQVLPIPKNYPLAPTEIARNFSTLTSGKSRSYYLLYPDCIPSIYIYVYMYVCIYIYIYTYNHIYILHESAGFTFLPMVLLRTCAQKNTLLVKSHAG